MDSDSTPLLEIDNLHVQFDVFGGSLRILDGVNLTLRAGEKLGLVGETGAGKTTTMKSVLRILPQPPARIREGRIVFEGQNLLQLSPHELAGIRGRGIAMIFQDPTAALNPVFTIGEQIGAVIRHAAPGGRLSKREVAERSVEPLREVALADPERLLRSYPLQLSGGMRQRVCIAMALAASPRLLIADEPGTSLDVTIQDQVLRLLHELVQKRNMSIILITHSLGVVRERTNRVAVMYAGTIVEEAPTARLFASPMHPYTQGLMMAVPKLTGGGVSDGVPGRMPTYLNPPQGCRFHPRCPRVMDICSQQKPSLYRVGDQHTVACFLYEGHPLASGQTTPLKAGAPELVQQPQGG